MCTKWSQTKWPWITVVLAVLFAFLPPIREAIHSALYSGEQLARTLSQLVLMVFAGIVFTLVIIEWGIRWYVARRRRAAPKAGPPHPMKES